MLSIENIAQRLDLLDTIIVWHRKEWGNEWADQVQQSTRDNQIPTVYVAIKDGIAVGTSMLLDYDMTTHPELTPWLGGVYVKPEHRGHGIATLLSKHAMSEATRMGITRLWLYTVSSSRLYEKLGWEYCMQENYLNEQATIMKVDLNKNPASLDTPKGMLG